MLEEIGKEVFVSQKSGIRLLSLVLFIFYFWAEPIARCRSAVSSLAICGNWGLACIIQVMITKCYLTMVFVPQIGHLLLQDRIPNLKSSWSSTCLLLIRVASRICVFVVFYQIKGNIDNYCQFRVKRFSLLLLSRTTTSATGQLLWAPEQIPAFPCPFLLCGCIVIVGILNAIMNYGYLKFPSGLSLSVAKFQAYWITTFQIGSKRIHSFGEGIALSGDLFSWIIVRDSHFELSFS